MKPLAPPLFMKLAASTVLVCVSVQAASADWITEKLQETCAGTSFMSKQAEDVRKQVEDYVNRSEAAIQPPSPVGDLSCLNDLMSSIDLTSIFSGAMPGMSSLMNKLGGAGLMAATGPGGIEGMICQFAQQKWQELTSKLQQAFQGGGSGGSGGNELRVPDFMENFGSANFPTIATGGDGQTTPILTGTNGDANNGDRTAPISGSQTQGLGLTPGVILQPNSGGNR
jgi:hypothetical protein